MMKKYISLLLLVISVARPVCADVAQITKVQEISDKQYYCTAANAGFFLFLCHLIGSIHKSNFDKTEEIAVFDLGLTTEQRDLLNTIEKVNVYDVEMVNPDLLTRFETSDQGKSAPGWYAWKPVVIKQALDMFDYVLYLDAGAVVLKPLDDVFRYIQEQGYFLLADQEWWIGDRNILFTIRAHCTKHVMDLFNLEDPTREYIAADSNLYAAVQGISKVSKAYNEYLLPIYELAKDIKNFEDDGSGPLGFGWARHDQTLFSIKARELGLTLVPVQQDVLLPVGNRAVLFKACDYPPENPHIVYACKGQAEFLDSIRFKQTTA
ncbi:hypothetical protein K2W90_03020 [Candidatus Babeliales bacterium]|nr:hypothetical protein [Candidatus Babeliales bacterium]